MWGAAAGRGAVSPFLLHGDRAASERGVTGAACLFKPTRRGPWNSTPTAPQHTARRRHRSPRRRPQTVVQRGHADRHLLRGKGVAGGRRRPAVHGRHERCRSVRVGPRALRGRLVARALRPLALLPLLRARPGAAVMPAARRTNACGLPLLVPRAPLSTSCHNHSSRRDQLERQSDRGLCRRRLGGAQCCSGRPSLVRGWVGRAWVLVRVTGSVDGATEQGEVAALRGDGETRGLELRRNGTLPVAYGATIPAAPPCAAPRPRPRSRSGRAARPPPARPAGAPSPAP